MKGSNRKLPLKVDTGVDLSMSITHKPDYIKPDSTHVRGKGENVRGKNILLEKDKIFAWTETNI